MDLTSILHAAISTMGGDPDAPDYDVTDLERAQWALRAVDAQIDNALGRKHLASVTIPGHLPARKSTKCGHAATQTRPDGKWCCITCGKVATRQYFETN